MQPILLVSGDFVRTGGMDMANFALAKLLVARGHEVHLVAHRVDSELSSYTNTMVHLVPKPLNSYLLARPFLNAYGQRWARSIATCGGRVIVNGGNCHWGDVNWVHYVHAAHRRRSSSWGLRAVRMRCSHVFSVHQEKSALSRARLIIANSYRTKRDLVERLQMDESRIRTIYLGTDPSRFRPSSTEERRRARIELSLPLERPLVSFVGALGDWRKGFDRLFEAWRALCSDHGWDADLLVAGSGAELSTWKRRVEEANLADRVRFLGFRKDVETILAASDALVSPARYDSYGLNVQEALCAGVPALVTENAGVAERFPQDLRQLLLRDTDQPEELAQSLRQWRLHMDSLREKVVRLSNVLRCHTWDAMSEEIVTAMEATR